MSEKRSARLPELPQRPKLKLPQAERYMDLLEGRIFELHAQLRAANERAERAEKERDEARRLIWISMKDRLPADHESVLTVWHGEVQRVAYRIVRGEWIASGDECDPAPLDTFSHWRPLPAPPSAEQAAPPETKD